MSKTWAAAYNECYAPPRDTISETPANQGPQDGGEAEHGGEEALEDRALPQGDQRDRDQDDTRHDPGSAETSDGAADDQGVGIWRDSAYEGTNLEDQNGEKEGPDKSCLIMLDAHSLPKFGRAYLPNWSKTYLLVS